MPITCEDAKAAYEHIIQILLDVDADSAIPTSLLNEQCNNVFSLFTLAEHDIDGLTYALATDPGTTLHLNKGQKGLLKAIIAFAVHKEERGEQILGKAWLTITKDEFDEFRVSGKYIKSLRVPKKRTPNRTVTNVNRVHVRYVSQEPSTDTVQDQHNILEQPLPNNVEFND